MLVRRVTLLAAGLSLTLNLSAGGERWRARSNQPIFAHNTAVSARTRPQFRSSRDDDSDDGGLRFDGSCSAIEREKEPAKSNDV